MRWELLTVAGIALLFALHAVASGRVRSARLNRRLHRLAHEQSGGRSGISTWQTWLQTVAAPLASFRERKRIAGRLAAAGLIRPWHVHAFLLGKLILVLAALAGGYMWFGIDLPRVHHAPFDALKYLFVLFLAARAPDWWLAGEVRKRQGKIRAGVPHAMDLLHICVEAGVNLEEAFGRVAAEAAGRYPEISAELRLTRSEMLLTDRSHALRRMEKRSGVKEMESLAAALLQSIHYGNPLAQALRTIASESRAGQIAELEEQAGGISARIGIPLVVLVLLPLVALIAAPAVVNLMRAF